MRPEPQHTRHDLGQRILSGTVPFLGLVLIWMLLCGQFTWLTLLTGAGIGALVSLLFYLPALRFGGVIRPLHAIAFLARLVVDVVRASVTVAWSAVGPRGPGRNAIIGVPLRTRSDIVMTFTAEALSIVPGSIVLDIDRERATLWLHILGVADEEGVEHARAAVLATERRIVLAFGSRDDRERLERDERGVIA